MTWVVADHSAAPGSRELSVSKGQQVEVLENGGGPGGNGEWTLVRLPSTPGQSEPPPEGLVPTSALKQPPTATCKTSPSRKPTAAQANVAQQASVNNDDGEYPQHDIEFAEQWRAASRTQARGDVCEQADDMRRFCAD